MPYVRLFIIPDPRSIAHKGDLKTMDQGSVLVVGKVRNLIYRPQPEVVPRQLL